MRSVFSFSSIQLCLQLYLHPHLDLISKSATLDSFCFGFEIETVVLGPIVLTKVVVVYNLDCICVVVVVVCDIS